MIRIPLHLAPNAPWIALSIASLALGLLARWAYRFAAPPLPNLARRALVALRLVALLILLWLLAQPVLERTRGADARVVVLLDRSGSMDLPWRPRGEARSIVAGRVVESLRRAMRGRAAFEVVPFAGALEPDSAAATLSRGATALGDALEQFGRSGAGQRATAVVVVSDGVVNAGGDPVAAAATLGIPVHAIAVGEAAGVDRSITALEAPPDARVGQREPVRVRITSSEPRGVTIPVRLFEGNREIASGTALSPGAGAEAVLDLAATPVQSGLAVWTARLDTLSGEISRLNNTRSVALQVAPGKLGVVILSGGLNWDLTFIRRALLGDSSLAVRTWTRDGGRWKALDARGLPGTGSAGEPTPADLRGGAVLVLDGVAALDAGAAFDRAAADFVRAGGGLLVLGGPAPGLERYRAGALGEALGVQLAALGASRSAAPSPTEAARDVLAWDDDPTRGQQAWREAAPLRDVFAIAPSAGDRVLIASSAGGPPLLVARRAGRGQALLVNGSGTWRWSLSPTDDLAAERGRRLWRRLVRWLAEPVQGEPLRVRPEHWLTASGESVRLFATLQDSAFRPLAGARIEGELVGATGSARSLRFQSGAPGSYEVALHGLAPGRYRVTARSRREDGRDETATATTEFAVDRWSLEEARTEPDSATLAAMARSSGGLVLSAGEADRNAGRLPVSVLTRGRPETVRLWESPWVLALAVGALSVEWAWRRRRGLP